MIKSKRESDSPKTGRAARAIFPCYIAVGLVCVIFLIVEIFNTFPIGLEHRPEQSDQVTVLEKRIHKFISAGGKGGYSKSYTFIVAFEFPDGSIKEFEVDDRSTRSSKTELYSPLYNAIHKGDTGVLSYKEVEGVEKKHKNEMLRFEGRAFVSFEKVSEDGVVKLELYKSSHKAKDMVLVGASVFVVSILAVWGYKYQKKIRAKKKRQRFSK